ncbi:hypothetical protein AB0M47_08670 [Hamadaea sp. NPDC051192]|uniref:hypothetical protein n=1 Tax=Hamadaea sp. NPDC051192 TaxID=3154940 RepID=UPI00342A31B3
MSADLRPLFTADVAAVVHSGSLMAEVPRMPSLKLHADTLSLLRDGLGHHEIEVKWLGQLDQQGTLRLWRSWTGHLMYEAIVTIADAGIGTVTVTGLRVERDTSRYTGSIDDEPATFERVIIGMVNLMRQLRAGHGSCGPVDGAEPLPSRWTGA